MLDTHTHSNRTASKSLEQLTRSPQKNRLAVVGICSRQFLADLQVQRQRSQSVPRLPPATAPEVIK